MGKQPAYIVDSDMVLEFLARLTTFLEKVRPEPDLLQMSLVRVLCQNLLDGYFSLGRAMNPKPHDTEPSSAQ